MSGITEEWVAALALQNMEGIGPVIGRRLLEHFGSFAEVFESGPRELKKLSGVPAAVIDNLQNKDGFSQAEEELTELEKRDVLTYVISDQRFPKRLKQCSDSPLILFCKGDADLNGTRILSVVGSRRCSEYAETQCRRIIQALTGSGVMILSGLAYGVDIIAHRTAIECQIPTLAALAHGMDRIYPSVHRKTALKMLDQGGAWVTEFSLGTSPDRENFPKRNRLIAGMADATLVIESGVKGGSMITASLAFDYNREVFALPGDVSNENVRGCHDLIRRQKAALIEGGEDILDLMGWKKEQKVDQQLPLLLDWTPEELMVREILGKSQLHLDQIAERSQLLRPELLNLILQMELKGMLRSVPGMRYKLA